MALFIPIEHHLNTFLGSWGAQGLPALQHEESGHFREDSEHPRAVSHSYRSHRDLKQVIQLAGPQDLCCGMRGTMPSSRVTKRTK